MIFNLLPKNLAYELVNQLTVKHEKVDTKYSKRACEIATFLEDMFNYFKLDDLNEEGVHKNV